jgi:hypothetical protein
MGELTIGVRAGIMGKVATGMPPDSYAQEEER